MESSVFADIIVWEFKKSQRGYAEENWLKSTRNFRYEMFVCRSGRGK